MFVVVVTYVRRCQQNRESTQIATLFTASGPAYRGTPRVAGKEVFTYKGEMYLEW